MRAPKLGDRVKDTVTGFEGIAVGKTDWLYGCTRFTVASEKMHEGKPVTDQWFDEQRLEVVAENAIRSNPAAKAEVGGPQNDPVRRTGG